MSIATTKGMTVQEFLEFVHRPENRDRFFELERGEIVEEVLCRAFVANYVPSRGYGRGARAVLEAMEDGRDYRSVADQHFPGGSFGNGAAMRVARAM